MQIGVVDQRNLAIAVGRLDVGRRWNWSTTACETPVSVSSHLKKFASVEPAPSVIATVQSVDAGAVLLQCPDVSSVVFVVDPTSGSATPLDHWTSPNPVPIPAVGGYFRGFCADGDRASGPHSRAPSPAASRHGGRA
jgi:hypothetical protein